MHAIKRARQFIAADPAHPDALKLSRLVLALESDTPFQLTELYGMELPRFDLALQVLAEWRLDRYYVGKARLFDLSWQVNEGLADDAGADAAPGGVNAP